MDGPKEKLQIRVGVGKRSCGRCDKGLEGDRLGEGMVGGIR